MSDFPSSSPGLHHFHSAVAAFLLYVVSQAARQQSMLGKKQPVMPSHFTPTAHFLHNGGPIFDTDSKSQNPHDCNSAETRAATTLQAMQRGKATRQQMQVNTAL